MRGVVLIAVGALAMGAATFARGVVSPAATKAVTGDLSTVNFNLAAPDHGRAERLPEATTLGNLSSGDSGKPAEPTASKSPPKTAISKSPSKPAVSKSLPKTAISKSPSKPAVSKSPPKTAATVTPPPMVKPKPKISPPANATWQGKPMSAWRRAYIAKHGHQPPVAAK